MAADAVSSLILAAEVERVPVGTLAPMPGNPRRGDVAAIAASLQVNGQYRPLVVSRDNVILAGNHTWQAAVSLGWPEIAVTRIPVTHDDPRAKRIVLADNRTSDLAHDDPADLAALLEEVAAADGGLYGTGFDDAALAELLGGATPAAPPEDFAEYDEETIETQYRCPSCSYEWSGKPK